MANPGYSTMVHPSGLEAGLEILQEDIEELKRKHRRMQQIIAFMGNPLYMGMLAGLILSVEMGSLWLTGTLDDFISFLLRRLEAAIMFIALLLPLVGKVIHHFHEQLQGIRDAVTGMPHTVNNAVTVTLREEVKRMPGHVVHGVKTEVPAAIMALLQETIDIEKMIVPKLEEMEHKLIGVVKDVPPSILHEIRELRDVFANKFGHMKDGLVKAGVGAKNVIAHASHGVHKGA